MKNTRVAFMFDFDGTLIDGFMQDYKLMELIKTNTEDFWKEIYAFAEEHNMDHNSAFLYKLIEVSKRNGVQLTREKLVECGKYMPFFKGVKEFFPRIKEYLLGSVAGMIPGLILTGIIGANITNPLSVPFLGSCALQLAGTLGSLYIYKKKIKRKDKPA